ncbi:ABC transporter permease [Sphingomonas canadensis]|uniref:ABC transporter permease n=1 Tax=Sphingomonas canadensis TaxID=1219257 RepID=A0ABW3H5F9_9SPHN|nr:ABC transporter permease [Sphingomonas canadensis]MCW3835203.1 ABC transporter permease [Sphingomonas canadensis]
MPAILIRRLATAIPTLFAVVLLSFLLMRVAPGSPFDSERPLDPAIRAAMERAYGLDQPLPVQLGRYLANIATGDFGPSLVYKDFTVSKLIAQGLPVSLQLGGLALLLAALLGVGGGIAGALRPGGWIDRSVSVASSLAVALPSFVTGPVLALVFALWLAWLPVSGLGGPSSLVLPVIALALPVAGAVARLTRTGLAAALAQDHVRTARARGIAPVRVIVRHALPPALIPVVSYLGPAAAGLLTGAVVIETVFGLPGLGRYFVQGALNRDYPLVMGVVILYAGLILLFNLIADLLYGWLDPRVRG